jgi:hypothetical protein
MGGILILLEDASLQGFKLQGLKLRTMFGLRPKLPITEDERLWVDEGFSRLNRMVGWSRTQNTPVVLPTDEYFPDAWDATEVGLETLFKRVCGYMRVPRNGVELTVVPDSSELLDMLPAYSDIPEDPAGLHMGGDEEEHPLIAVRRSLLKDPLTLVATLAHELAHVILLDGGQLSRDAEDMEPLTDLATVYLGMGVFTANAARRFRQYQEDTRQGWSMERLGYLPETVYGYALARFAKNRGEGRPPWANYLSTNLKAWFRQSAAWLERDSRPMR